MRTLTLTLAAVVITAAGMAGGFLAGRSGLFGESAPMPTAAPVPAAAPVELAKAVLDARGDAANKEASLP